MDIKKVKLSMKLGGEYRFRNIAKRHWRRMAEQAYLDTDKAVQRVSAFAAQLADHVSDIQRSMAGEGIDHPLVRRLARRLTTRAAACQRVLR